MLEQHDDLFDDQSAPQSEGESKTFDEPVKEQSETPTSDTTEQPNVDDQPGDKENVEPPSTQQEGDKVIKAEKMIPESRFKAALKDATEKLEAANKELATFKAQPVPDRTADPEGYDLHVRMEASKAAMIATHTDYQEVIEHYKEMADTNPYLNEAVAKHPIPAQYAYQIAKEDMRLRRLGELESSDDWKQFQEWKKAQGTAKPNEAQVTSADNKIGKQLSEGSSKVPNLNRATNVSKVARRAEQDDELFSDSPF